MPESDLQTVSVQVPINMGLLIGNTLRQFSMRGSKTWQPAAYKISEKDGTFGLGGEYNFNVLVFNKGRLVSNCETADTTEMLCDFERVGEDYVCGDMVIKGLGFLRAPSMSVCLVYAGGLRSKENNFAVAKRLCGQDANSYVIVPSRHTPTVKFSFKVEPLDLTSEMLLIEATPGVASMARDAAVKSLKGLHI